ncbi:MAG: GGDEF domain-containing protein [Candidatus Diapherotrites archaeon]|nr:GGDEF domain-containing protein [Candidatus Diapherotrites archaeon]
MPPGKKRKQRRKPVVGQIPLPVIPKTGHRRNPIHAADSLRKAEERFTGAMQELERVRPREAKESRLKALAAAGKLVGARAKLRFIAQLDSKFNILNNMAFVEKTFSFLRSQKAQKGFALATVDMDHLKRINTRHGHEYADMAIGVYIQAVSEAAKNCRGFAGRFGGDELRVFAPVGAEKLKRALEEALGTMQTYGLGFSAGVAESKHVSRLRTPQKKFDSLCKLSDKAAYKSKRAGRSRVTIF